MHYAPREVNVFGSLASGHVMDGAISELLVVKETR